MLRDVAEATIGSGHSQRSLKNVRVRAPAASPTLRTVYRKAKTDPSPRSRDGAIATERRFFASNGCHDLPVVL